MYTPIVAFIMTSTHNNHTDGTSGEAYAFAYHFLNGILVQEIQIFAKYDTRLLSDGQLFRNSDCLV